MSLDEKMINSEYVYKGRIFSVKRDNVLLPNSKTAVREVVEHPGAVAILALTDDNKVILIKQFRYAFGDVMIEIPAGKFESKDESPFECAVRELKEETGFDAKNMVQLGVIRPSPGCLNEVIYLFLATGLIAGECSPDEDEFLESQAVDFHVVEDMILDGRITDAKTIAAVFHSRTIIYKK